MYLALCLLSFFLVAVVYILFLWMSMKVDSSENSISAYECGFDQVMGSRLGFSYRFFLISILFLVFDVEITLLIPLTYVVMGGWGMGGLVLFLMILFWGLIYEYYNGVLDWL